mmetsp:Transcript_32836/g.46649  ORF Transcript_32836/g.46649 Transcript_32836/m.46649 type:complete len:145 (+) Transcript_32836:109-543(+)|eukprot:CAMPEP_0202455630 /NCGR_PEP_ID=MMETSP1360-20130828/13107_1 /ASSEMBLY_ACC=CAM_ASM_000848 /TAXON_ID=515479 /ORGANISM="Licmophora paradoxa, Strain CCMP2313" /LENGTH=144 /DNA_ID=CAMNT_0049075251 /DNA_START=87 /DNA_END=521 /DNA_ORIENTATION=+
MRTFLFILELISLTIVVSSFTVHTPVTLSNKAASGTSFLSKLYAESQDDGVVELGDTTTATSSSETSSSFASAAGTDPADQSVAPFLSQGEIADDVLNPDLSNPKQTRVIIYIILSLIPVLFLIPLMLGSRDLIPADMLPPVEM